MSDRAPFAIVASPGFIAAVLLLLANDHILKAAFPGIVTGKLSDVAGLFVVGALAIVVAPSRPAPLLGGVVALFVFWKSPLSQPLIDAWNATGPFKIARVVDWIDVLALSALPLALMYSRSAFRAVPTQVIRSFMLGLTVLATMATSIHRPPPPTWVLGTNADAVTGFHPHAKFTTPLSFTETAQRLEHAGFTVRWSLLPRWQNPTVHSSVRCGADDSAQRAFVTAETFMSGAAENTIEIDTLTFCRRFAPTSTAEALAAFEREVLVHLPNVRGVGREASR